MWTGSRLRKKLSFLRHRSILVMALVCIVLMGFAFLHSCRPLCPAGKTRSASGSLCISDEEKDLRVAVLVLFDGRHRVMCEVCMCVCVYVCVCVCVCVCVRVCTFLWQSNSSLFVLPHPLSKPALFILVSANKSRSPPTVTYWFCCVSSLQLFKESYVNKLEYARQRGYTFVYHDGNLAAEYGAYLNPASCVF